MSAPARRNSGTESRDTLVSTDDSLGEKDEEEKESDKGGSEGRRTVEKRLWEGASFHHFCSHWNLLPPRTSPVFNSWPHFQIPRRKSPPVRPVIPPIPVFISVEICSLCPSFPPPNPRAPGPGRSAPALTPHPGPFPPPPLSTPRLLPRFPFFFCSVAFNSSRPLGAEWLMAPCWVTVRGRKTGAEEEGKTGGDGLSRIPGV